MRTTLTFLLLLTAASSYAQPQQQVNTSPSTGNRSVSGTNPNSSNPFAAQQDNGTFIGSSGVGNGALLNTSETGGVFNASGWSSSAATDAGSAGYFYWSVQPARGTAFSGGNLRFTLFRNDSGPQEYGLRSSLDNFASDISHGVISDVSSDLTIPVNLPKDVTVNPDSPVTFRLYGYGARANFGVLKISNLGYAGGTLPVTTGLYGFGAKGSERGAVLTWMSQSEAGLSRYEIERSSDGKLFEIFATVPIRNERVNNYRYEDLTPFRARTFYRLVVVDALSHRSLSRAVLVSGSPITTLEGPLMATPNPMTASELTVSHPLALPNALLKITDATGQEVYTSAVAEGTVITNIQNLTLQKGNYYLTLENGPQRYSTILVK